MRVLYPGGFDMLHHAHITALQTARSIAGTLIVGVNSDRFMERYKRIPTRTEQRRVADVTATGLADEVIVWDGPIGQDQQILDVDPDVYIAGTDWLGKDLAAQLGLESLAWFDRHTISLMYLRRTPGISTTQLIERKACP